MTDRKNTVTRFRLWLRTFAKARTDDRKQDRVHYVRPNLEALEDRTVPSTMNALPPSDGPQVAAVLSFVDSMIELRAELFATIEQNVMRAYEAVGQEIAQSISSVQQQWGNFLGINPSNSDPSPTPAVTEPGGVGGITTTGRDAPPPSASDATAPPISTGHT